jgi:hypothetical protein
MELVPVESSNVAAIGYHEECRLLRVLFKNGSTYDFPGVDAATHTQIMQAESKSKAIAALERSHEGVRLSSSYAIKLREPASSNEPLQTYEPDPCCGPRLAKALPTLTEVNRWVCPKCGCEWWANVMDGVKHWLPREHFEVIR